MIHKGVIPGNTTTVDIDKLTYAYASYSNKLMKVTDNTTQTTTNGQSGDFKDGTNGSTDDYVYDNNGNLTIKPPYPSAAVLPAAMPIPNTAVI